MRLAGMLASGAIFGKLLGFIRELEMARLLGVSLVADSLRGAITAVLLPINPLQGELMTAGMIPLLRDWQDSKTGRQLTSALIFVFLLLGVVVMAFVAILAAPWVGLLVAGFSPEAQDLTIRLTRIMALAIPASVFAAALSGVEISHGRSRITVLRMALQNIGVILGIAVMAVTGHAESIAWGFTIAFNLVALYGFVILFREGYISISGLHFAIFVDAVRMFLKRVKSLTILPFMEQGSLLVERTLASAAAAGTLASLDYARTLTECALFLISQPIGYVILARKITTGSGLHRQVRDIVAPLLALCVPASVFLACFSVDVVRIIFERGRFGDDAVAMTSHALLGISLGLWASTIGWILIRLLNAEARNSLAATVVACSWLANICANLVLVPHYGALGLGLSEAIRGVVLFSGAVIALGLFHTVLRQLLPALGMALVMTVLALLFQASMQGITARLLVSGSAFGLIGLFWLYFALPKGLMPQRLAARLPFWQARGTEQNEPNTAQLSLPSTERG